MRFLQKGLSLFLLKISLGLIVNLPKLFSSARARWKNGEESKSDWRMRWRTSQTGWSPIWDQDAIASNNDVAGWRKKWQKNLQFLINNIVTCRWLKLNKKTTTPSKWKTWRLLTTSARKNFKSCMRRNLNSKSNNSDSWKKSKKKCVRSRSKK